MKITNAKEQVNRRRRNCEKNKRIHAEVQSLEEAISGRVLVSRRIKRIVQPIEFARSIVIGTYSIARAVG